MTRALAIAACAVLLVVPATAQKGSAQKGGGSTTSTLPIVNSLSPTSKAAASGSFILTVTGSNYTTGSVVRWGSTTLSTGYVSTTQLQATVGSSLITTTGNVSISVYTSGRKGGTSNSLTFTITDAVAPPPPPPPPPPPAPEPLSITTSSLPSVTAGSTFNANVAATGGTPAYLFGLVSSGGALPPGLALQSNGTIAGTPTQAGTFNFTTQASDNASQIAQKVLSITVGAPPPPPDEPPPPTETTPPLFDNGLEPGTFTGWDYVASKDSFTKINSNASFKRTGSYSAEFRYSICGDNTNSACGASAQDANRYMAKYFDTTRGYPNGLEHVFVRGYVYFKTPEPGGTVDGVQRKMIYMFDKTSSATWWLFMATDSQAGRMPLRVSTNSLVGVPPVTYWNLTTLDYNQWYCVELEVKPNTPGMSDGVLRLWINGGQVWEKTGLNLRGTATTGIQSVRIGEQANRLNYNPIEEYRYWDDVKISTAYIGPQ